VVPLGAPISHWNSTYLKQIIRLMMIGMFRIRGGKGKDNPQTLVYCVYKRNEMCSFSEK
jgi:hypothetical protein